MHNAHTCWNPEPIEPIMSLNDSRLDLASLSYNGEFVGLLGQTNWQLSLHKRSYDVEEMVERNRITRQVEDWRTVEVPRYFRQWSPGVYHRRW